MKKILAALLCVGMLLSLAACAPDNQTTRPSTEASGFEGLSESVVEALGKMGYTEEKWNSLSAQEQQAVLTAVYAMLRGESATQPTDPGKYTLKDVEGQGRFMVTVADSKMQNFFELYYRNGVLMKIHVNILGEDGEDDQVMDVSGDEIPEFDLFSIDYTAGVAAVVDALKAQGYIRIFIAKR